MKPSVLIPVSALSVLLAHIPVALGQIDRVSPSLKRPFTVPLPIPPIKKPITSFKDHGSGTEIDYYELKISPFKKVLFPDLVDGTGASLVGYDGMEPGPTFLVPKGRETLVRLINENTGPGGNDRPSSMHLHGSYCKSHCQTTC